MNFAVEQVNAGDIEGRRKRSILRRILIQDDMRSRRFHQKRNRMARTRAAVVDFEINSLTSSNGGKRGPRDLTSEPVPRLVGEIIVSAAPPSAWTILGVSVVSASSASLAKFSNAELSLFIVVWVCCLIKLAVRVNASIRERFGSCNL